MFSAVLRVYKRESIWPVTPDSDFTFTVLSVNVLLVRRHEHYNETVETSRNGTVV